MNYNVSVSVVPESENVGSVVHAGALPEPCEVKTFPEVPVSPSIEIALFI